MLLFQTTYLQPLGLFSDLITGMSRECCCHQNLQSNFTCWLFATASTLWYLIYVLCAAGESSLQGAGASKSMCNTCCWIVHRSGSSSGTGGAMDGAGGGGNSGCDVVAAVFGLASGVCSVASVMLPIPHDRAPQVH
jgi:hypothetical protein